MSYTTQQCTECLPEVELVDSLLAADELGLTTDIAPDADSRTHKCVKMYQCFLDGSIGPNISAHSTISHTTS